MGVGMLVLCLHRENHPKSHKSRCLTLSSLSPHICRCLCWSLSAQMPHDCPSTGMCCRQHRVSGSPAHWPQAGFIWPWNRQHCYRRTDSEGNGTKSAQHSIQRGNFRGSRHVGWENRACMLGIGQTGRQTYEKLRFLSEHTQLMYAHVQAVNCKGKACIPHPKTCQPKSQFLRLLDGAWLIHILMWILILIFGLRLCWILC